LQLFSGKSTDQKIQCAGATTLGGGTAISGGGTLDTGCGPFRLNLTTSYTRQIVRRAVNLITNFVFCLTSVRFSEVSSD